mgnify:FL=1
MSDVDNNANVDVETKTFTEADIAKLDARAKNFEAKFVDATKQLERFKGIDPDDFHGMKQRLKELEVNDAGGDPSKIDALVQKEKEKLEKDFRGALDEKETKLTQAQRELKELRVTNVVMNKAANVFNADALDLISGVINKSCDFQDGQIVVIGEDGEALRSKKNPRELMQVDEYLEQLAEKYPSTAKAKGINAGRTGGEKTGAMHDSFNPDLNKYLRMSDAQQKEFLSKLTDDQVKQLFKK